jgi:hypothetical protein
MLRRGVKISCAAPSPNALVCPAVRAGAILMTAQSCLSGLCFGAQTIFAPNQAGQYKLHHTRLGLHGRRRAFPEVSRAVTAATRGTVLTAGAGLPQPQAKLCACCAHDAGRGNVRSCSYVDCGADVAPVNMFYGQLVDPKSFPAYPCLHRGGRRIWLPSYSGQKRHRPHAHVTLVRAPIPHLDCMAGGPFQRSQGQGEIKREGVAQNHQALLFNRPGSKSDVSPGRRLTGQLMVGVKGPACTGTTTCWVSAVLVLMAQVTLPTKRQSDCQDALGTGPRELLCRHLCNLFHTQHRGPLRLPDEELWCRDVAKVQALAFPQAW